MNVHLYCFFNLMGSDNMGVNFGFGKKRKMRKLLVAYLENRLKEKKSFEEQLQRLGVQLRKETIDQLTFERMRAALEINFIRQREEAREHMQKTFLNTFPI